MALATFAELGVPFPLFEAPTSEASEYAGLSSCRLCGGQRRHCFRLDIGCDVVLPCPACGADNGLDVRDRQDASCRSCGSAVPFPELLKEVKEIHVCYDCLRVGKGAIKKNTEFGMVTWEQASQGVTHGLPGLETTEFERVLVDPDEDWYGVRIPREHLFELLRTPSFHNWQDETWLFCCKRPMTYVGEWANVLKSQLQGVDPRAVFERVFDPTDPSKDWVWERLSRRRWDTICVYVFRCKVCDRFGSTWDTE